MEKILSAPDLPAEWQAIKTYMDFY